jgi:hypothetical protein
VLHASRPAKWTHVFITMNRAVGDYELYPKTWKEHPSTRAAFWARVKSVVYFHELRKCEHILKPQEDGVQPPEVNIAAYEAKKDGGLDDKHGQGEEMPVLSDTARLSVIVVQEDSKGPGLLGIGGLGLAASSASAAAMDVKKDGAVPETPVSQQPKPPKIGRQAGSKRKLDFSDDEVQEVEPWDPKPKRARSMKEVMAEEHARKQRLLEEPEDEGEKVVFNEKEELLDDDALLQLSYAVDPTGQSQPRP